jgi:hypothetical protein
VSSTLIVGNIIHIRKRKKIYKYRLRIAAQIGSVSALGVGGCWFESSLSDIRDGYKDIIGSKPIYPLNESPKGLLIYLIRILKLIDYYIIN